MRWEGEGLGDQEDSWVRGQQALQRAQSKQAVAFQARGTAWRKAPVCLQGTKISPGTWNSRCGRVLAAVTDLPFKLRQPHFDFFQPFENVETILSSRTRQKQAPSPGNALSAGVTVAERAKGQHEVEVL